MTVTYTNELKSNVLDPLKGLIFTEFKPMDVIFEPEFNGSYMRRGQYIRYWFLESTLESVFATGETRNYSIEVTYYFDVRRHSDKIAFDKVYSDEAEHLKRLLEDYYSYDDGTYRWHALSINMSKPTSVAELEEIENEDTMAIKFDVTITRNNFR